jgi:hypothetical protein
MKWKLLTIVLLLCAGAAQAGEYGYTDSPFLPGAKWRVHDKNRPEPVKVRPGAACFAPAPADAVVLFDGKDLSQWKDVKPGGIEGGSFDVRKTGQIQTKESFGDCQLHVEWQIPAKPDGDWQIWGNSGVFLLGLYEVQIIESYTYQIYADGIAGAIYGQTPPLVNAALPPGQWQSYDIAFTAPRVDAAGKLLQPAYFTIFWNGVLVQNHVAALGPTRHKELATYDNKATTGPVMLQYHGSHVHFRNVWIRPIKSQE